MGKYPPTLISIRYPSILDNKLEYLFLQKYIQMKLQVQKFILLKFTFILF
jgi:hypothetical protein